MYHLGNFLWTENFLPIPGFETMPYLYIYLQVMTLPTGPPITWQMNVSEFWLTMNCKFEFFYKRSAT